jgi:DNA-binding transcriptional regulator YiaG
MLERVRSVSQRMQHEFAEIRNRLGLNDTAFAQRLRSVRNAILKWSGIDSASSAAFLNFLQSDCAAFATRF